MITDILPYIDYVNSDKSIYPFANTIIDEDTGNPFIDKDNDFRIGNSGGFLMDISFKFINVHLFSEVARDYEKNIKDKDLTNWINSLVVPDTENRGKYFYCPALPGTTEYEAFWRRESDRRRNGMTAKCKLLSTGEIVDLHITGDHYNYLNYSRLNRTPTKLEQQELHDKGDFKTKLISGFPRFWDGDYWNFKIDFFISSNGYHLCKGKARGKGYSFKRGSQAANTLNLIPKATVVLAAYILDYLTDADQTSDMCKTNLDWLENNTYWKRGYISENLENIELGHKTKKGGNKKYGYRSKLFSVPLRGNESGAIGKRAIEIDFEEAGKLPNLEEALGVTLSSTEVGAGNVGTIRVYGTAGTKDANWQPFSNVFFNPAKNDMMPFENVWDYNARNTVCGFFHPQVLNMEPFVDIDGNSMLLQAYAYDIEDKRKKELELDAGEYIIYVGQRANTPEEAFKRGGKNLFSSIELTNHANRVINNIESQYYRDGMLVEEDIDGLVFRTNEQLKAAGLGTFAHDYIIDVPFTVKKDFYGCIREYYPPYKINGVVPKDLYYISMDTIAKDKDSATVINANSLISIGVWMYPNNYANTSGDILVAQYTGRPDRMEDGDKILLKMCRHWNAKALVEVDRGDTVSNFRKWGMLYWLYKDPTIILSNKQTELSNASYGINIGSGSNATDGLIYFRDWLYTKRAVDEAGNIKYTFHYIYDVPMLKELLSFNMNGNFDRISMARVAMFILRAIQVRNKRDILNNKNGRTAKSIYEEIGLYSYKT